MRLLAGSLIPRSRPICWSSISTPDTPGVGADDERGIARQIGSTANRARCSAMNPQITSVAGRSPMRRKTLLPRRFRSSVPARRSFASARLTGCEPPHEGYVPVLASSSLLRTTDRISDCPVSALSTESNVLVCNPLAAALFGDFSELSPTAGTSSGSNSSVTAATGSQHRRKRRRIPRV